MLYFVIFDRLCSNVKIIKNVYPSRNLSLKNNFEIIQIKCYALENLEINVLLRSNNGVF